MKGKWHYGSVYLGDGDKGAFLGVKNRSTVKGIEYEDAKVCDRLYERIAKAYINLSRL